MRLRTDRRRLNCLLLNMNSTNETLLFDRFLIMYNLCVFTCIIVMFVFHCTRANAICIKLLLTYLLTYLLLLLLSSQLAILYVSLGCDVCWLCR